MKILDTDQFYWAVGLTLGLPVILIGLTELHQALARRQSALARPVNLLRSYLVPLLALLVLLVKVAQVQAQVTSVRILATVFGFRPGAGVVRAERHDVEGAPQGSWRDASRRYFVT